MRLNAILLGACMGVAFVAACSAPPEAVSTAATASFTDCAECPEMVVIPAGQFTMGSPASEMYRGAETQHRVTISSPFALSKYEVTFEQWDRCVADGGCNGVKPDDFGWGRGNRPIIGVNWNDAKAYVAWLSKKTSKPYRLPSESEWEYAARAGTTTAYHFGDTVIPKQVNFDASMGDANAPSDTNRQKTLSVGTFPPNAFGLHDMHGNVWEWTEDCWSDEYTDATPADGKPYLAADCGGRVLRGGSWEDYAGDVRAAARVSSNVDDGTWSDGFRVARNME